MGRLGRVSKRWRVRIGERLGGGSRSEVFAGTLDDGRPVVVKLAAARDRATREATALRVWAAFGVTAELLDADPVDHALLVAQVYPGVPISPSKLAAAAAVLRVLHAVPLPDLDFPTVEDAYSDLERNSVEDAAYEQAQRNEPDRGRAGLDRLDAARNIVATRCRTATRRVLLHGDFLVKNLLLDGAGYRAIDPAPMIGDPGADIGFFAASHGPVGTVLIRVRTLAVLCQQDPLRAERWAVAWTVLDTASAWRDDQAELEQFLVGEHAERLLHE
jgi:streptomycin 6-kinase